VQIIKNWFRRVAREEDGHVYPALTGAVAAVGAILLTVAVTGDNDTLAWIGGVVMAVAFVGGSLVEHMQMDYPVYARLEALEKK
jgi:hypothetical protein